MDINIIHQIAITVLVPLITQGVKKIQAIPISEGQTARIRTFVGLTTFALTAITAYMDGNLDSVLSPQMIEVGLATAISFALAHFGYKGVQKVTE